MAVRPVAPRRRIEARSGETPVRRCHNSDDWLRGTASMASAQAIQASCQATGTQKVYYSEMVTRYVAGWAPTAPRMQNLRFAHFLCGAQEMSKAACRRFSGVF